MPDSTQSGNLRVYGTLIPDVLTIPAGTIRNADVSASAAIAATKLVHRHTAVWAQPNTAATAETRAIHLAQLAGTINSVKAGSIAKAVGDSTVTVDVRKNGTTILTGVITLDNANTNRVAEAGTISGGTTAVATGDLIEVVLTATVGTGTLPTGVFVAVEIDEAGV